MKNNKNWLGILAIMLVFGIMVVGCDSGSTNSQDKKGDLARLTVVNEYSETITRVKTAAGLAPDFKHIDKTGLSIATGKSQTFEIEWFNKNWESNSMNITLYAENLGGQGYSVCIITVKLGKTTTVKLTSDGQIEATEP